MTLGLYLMARAPALCAAEPVGIATGLGVMATPLATDDESSSDGHFRTMSSPWLAGFTLDGAYSFNDVLALGLGLHYEHVYGRFVPDDDTKLGARQLVVPLFLRIRLIGNQTQGLYVVPAVGYLSAWNYHQSGATEDGSALRTEGTSTRIGLEYRHELVPSLSLRVGLAARLDFSHSKNGVVYFRDMTVIRTAIPFRVGAAYEF